MANLTFIEDTHEYFLGDKKLISVTQLMQKYGLSPDYSKVPQEILRAQAERGSLVHKEIEDYIKEGNIGFTNELVEFINADKGEVLKSEFKVNNDIVAGTVDLLLYKNNEYIIADLKTTSELHIDAVSWQLTIYAYLLSKINPMIKVTKGQAFHFNKDGNLNIVDIVLKPFEEIDRLMECERNNEKFELKKIASDEQLMQLLEVEALIKSIEEKKKKAEEQAKELRAELMKAMEANGVKSFENDLIRITYVAPSTRQSIDSAKLKKEQPAIYASYLKSSEVKASLRITLKDE